MAMVKKPSRGRQRIEIKRIVKEDSRQVTFSKRRGGLFKKASELCILCGAEVAIIVFSPAGKAFSFGHPSVETIIDRFLTQNPTLDYGLSLVDAHRGVNVRGLNRQYTEVENQLDMEKKKGEKLLKMRKDSKEECWWESPIETLSLDQLERLRSSLGELKKNVANRADELLVENSMPSFFGTNQMDLVNSFSLINSMGMTNSVGIADEFEPKVMVNNTTMASQSYGFGFRGHGFY